MPAWALDIFEVAGTKLGEYTALQYIQLRLHMLIISNPATLKLAMHNHYHAQSKLANAILNQCGNSKSNKHPNNYGF